MFLHLNFPSFLNLFRYMKTLIEIRREIWGKVKDLATVRNISVNLAVEQLLTKALVDSGYLLGGDGPARIVN